MRGVLSKHGYNDKEISEILIASLHKENEGYKKAIYNLEMLKFKNKVTEDANIKLFSLPSADNADKVMKYEKSIQKSIFQNLAILKKLQSLH